MKIEKENLQRSNTMKVKLFKSRFPSIVERP